MLRRFEPLIPNLINVGFDVGKVEKFVQWDHENDWVWTAIKDSFSTKYNAGRKTVGMKEIFEELRANPEYHSRSDFKLDNNWTSFYGHTFLLLFPSAEGVLRVRQIKKN